MVLLWLSCGRTRPSLHRDDLVVASYVAQYVARDLFDHIGIGDFGGQQSDVALELCSHRFEAPDLEIKERGTLDQLAAHFEAMPAVPRVVDEIGRRRQASKQHQRLLEARPIPPIRDSGT